MFRFVIHLEFIFVYGVRCGSDFILFHADASWSFMGNQLTLNIWVYFWILSSVPLTYMYACPHAHTSVFITVTLCWVLKLGSVSPPILFFFNIILAFLGPRIST